MASLSITQYRKYMCAALDGKLHESALTSKDFWVLAQADAMFPLLWSMLSSEQKQAAEPYLITPMNERVFIADALRMKHTTARVLRAFNQHDIPVICMRGLAISETLYPHAYLRPHTDIDILIHPENTLMAKQVIGNELHFAPVPSYPMLFKQGDIPLDLHIEPIGAERIEAWKHITPLHTRDFFKYSREGELAGVPALHVHPRVMLPYLCFHALKHSFERLIWLYDIKLLVEQVSKDNNWEEVARGIAEYRLERPCFYALSYVKEHMHAPVPDDLLENIRPDMGFIEQRLFRRLMKHEIIPYLAERLFSRMLPSLKLRLAFWKETIYPKEEVRKQIAGGGCVKCNFIRTRLKQIIRAAWSFAKELVLLARA